MGKTYHYTYRIKFPSQGWFYYGLHSTDDLNDGYCGSPKTHKEKWDLFAWEMEILEFHETREIAYLVEKRLISHFLNDEHCLNMAAGGLWSISVSRVNGKRNVESGHLRKISSLGGKAARDTLVEMGHFIKNAKIIRTKCGHKIQSTCLNTGEQRHFESIRQAAEDLKLDRNRISMCLKGSIQRTRNFTFEYK